MGERDTAILRAAGRRSTRTRSSAFHRRDSVSCGWKRERKLASAASPQTLTFHHSTLGGALKASMTEANPDGVITEIRELNLSYLLLAQRLLREDRAMAMFRLGVSSEIAELIEGLTLAQTVKLAAVSNPLCRFRMDEQIFLSAIADKGRGATPTQMHAAVLLAAQPVEAFR